MHFANEKIFRLDAGVARLRPLQKQIFTRVLQKCAEAGGKILTVHSVRAATTVLDLIESRLNRRQSQIVLHWFTGSKSEARRAIDLGCYFSINAAMLRNDRGCSLVAMLPSDRLLTETDAPFTRINDRPTSPNDIKSTVEMLAALFQKNPGEMAHTISSNLRAMLRAAGIADSSQVHD